MMPWLHRFADYLARLGRALGGDPATGDYAIELPPRPERCPRCGGDHEPGDSAACPALRR